MRLKIFQLFAIVLVFYQTSYAASETEENDLYAQPRLVAVQNRKYNVNKHLSVLAGYLPADSFTKGITVGAAYTYYFTDFSAWELLNANYVFNQDTGLKKDLIAGFNAQPENDRLLDFPQYYITTGFLYTPLYNKNLLFNRSVVYGENSFVIAAGAAKFKQAGFLPLVGGGIIFRYFVGPSSDIKLDFREWVYKDEVRGVNSIMDIKIGYEMQLGDSPRDTE